MLLFVVQAWTPPLTEQWRLKCLPVYVWLFNVGMCEQGDRTGHGVHNTPSAVCAHQSELLEFSGGIQGPCLSVLRLFGELCASVCAVLMSLLGIMGVVALLCRLSVANDCRGVLSVLFCQCGGHTLVFVCWPLTARPLGQPWWCMWGQFTQKGIVQDLWAVADLYQVLQPELCVWGLEAVLRQACWSSHDVGMCRSAF